MNIFYLDNNPKLCAQYYCDKHVVKMILESAQILCTAINETVREQITPYKSTHVNHPCVKWAMESYDNWLYLCFLMIKLEEEWQYRFNHTKKHKSVEILLLYPGPLLEIIAEKYLPNKSFTVPPLCMPEYCKVPNDPVQSYRNYYNNEKQHLFKWTNREVPFWIVKN